MNLNPGYNPIHWQIDVLSKCGQGNSTDAVKSDAKQCLALALLEQIKSSC